jgi:hypothetical protein
MRFYHNPVSSTGDEACRQTASPACTHFVHFMEKNLKKGENKSLPTSPAPPPHFFWLG